MSVTVAIRFPLGRYHATPWDHSVNEGVVEWPPAPWRLLRALVATWYTRWPDLPAPELDGLLEALGEPPSYRTPSVLSPAHTRHYLPDLDHKKGETGNTDLTLDPYLRVNRDDELLVHWDVELTDEQRGTLAKLVELMPYLGRAESVCQARVLDTDAAPDEHWWRPMTGGAQSVRLLAPRRPVSRPALELTTVEMRRQRRTIPPGATWVTYGRAAADRSIGHPSRTVSSALTPVTAVRFAVMSRAPLMATYGVLLADVARRRVIRQLNGGPREVLGHQRATTDHQHAHWLPVPDPEYGVVKTFVVWVPAGLTAADVAAIAGSDLRRLSGRLGGDDGYEVKGLPMVDLLLQAAGSVETVAPELCGPARRWRSLTPYLPVRHRKRESLDDYVRADVCKELAYRGRDPQQVTVGRASADEGIPDRWARSFRRYRISDRMSRARPGLGIQLEFPEPTGGPLAIGQLSHFGLGLFAPDD